jgi:D-galactarolactone cycloisomerase
MACRGTAIREVKTHVLEARLKAPFAYSQAWYATRGAMLVEITTEDGVTGWGEAFGPAKLTAPIVDWYAQFLIGRDAMATEAIWQELYNRLRDHGQKGLPIEALSAVDIALWDIRGKVLNQPVHVLMGGPLRTEVQAYATGLYRREDADHERYLREEAAGYAADGFRAMKLKIGFGVEHDIAMTRALRSEIGDGIALMVDANHAWDATAAIRYGRGVEALAIGWFEEPVPPEDLAGYREVRRALSIPVAGGEAEFTRFGFRPLLVDRGVDVLQPDICAAGGLSETLKIAHMANAFGVRCNPHVWGTGIAQAAALQLLAVLPDNPPGLYPEQPLLEFDLSEHPIRQAVLQKPISQRGGRVAVPNGPGLGIEIDRSALDRFRA